MTKNEPAKFNFEVQPTKDRIGAKGDFIIQMNRQILSGVFKNGKKVVIEHCIPGGLTYRITAKVYPKTTPIDNKGEVLMDQKLRDALLVKAGGKVCISLPEKKKLYKRIPKIANLIIRYQTNIVRVQHATKNEMEIRLGLISQNTMNTIGIEPGDKIIIESVDADNKIIYRKMRVLELKDELLNERRKHQEYYSQSNNIDDNLRKHGIALKKYYTKDKIEECNKLDLPLILLDLDAREELKINVCSCVKIYRSPLFAFSKQLHFISVSIVLSILSTLFQIQHPIFDKGKSVFDTEIIYIISSHVSIIILVIFAQMFLIRSKMI